MSTCNQLVGSRITWILTDSIYIPKKFLPGHWQVGGRKLLFRVQQWTLYETKVFFVFFLDIVLNYTGSCPEIAPHVGSRTATQDQVASNVHLKRLVSGFESTFNHQYFNPPNPKFLLHTTTAIVTRVIYLSSTAAPPIGAICRMETSSYMDSSVLIFPCFGLESSLCQCHEIH